MQPIHLGKPTKAVSAALRIVLCVLLGSAIFWAGRRSASAFPAQDNPPPAPSGVTVTVETSKSVTLAWDSVTGAAAYRLYRSTLPGRGYDPIATRSAGNGQNTFTDSGLVNQVTYYYVVTTLDGMGAESAPSSEVSAMPHKGITGARVFPEVQLYFNQGGDAPLVFHAGFYLQGETGIHGPAQGVHSQVGIGPNGAPPAQWSNWFDARYEGLSESTNPLYDLVQAVVQPGDFPLVAGVSSYAFLFRFSTNEKDWFYAGPAGEIADPNQFLKDQLGSLLIQPPSDPVPPASPTSVLQDLNLLKPRSIHLTWAAPSGDQDVQFYDIFRANTLLETPGLVGRVAGNYHDYLDDRLVAGQRYFYTVRAVDDHSNYSPPSSPVLEAHTLPQTVRVTINVTLPPFTPRAEAGGNCAYLTQFSDPRDPGKGYGSMIAMAYSAALPNTCTVQLDLPDGQYFPFRFTRGDGDTIQTLADGNGLLPDPGPSFWVDGNNLSPTQTLNRSVDNWDDPLVTAYSPTGSCVSASGPVSITWNQAMDPAVRFSVEEQVAGNTYQAVAGEYRYHPETHSVSFIPTVPFPKDHTFRVTAENLTDLKGIAQKAPFRWTFDTGQCLIHLPAVFR